MKEIYFIPIRIGDCQYSDQKENINSCCNNTLGTKILDLLRGTILFHLISLVGIHSRSLSVITLVQIFSNLHESKKLPTTNEIIVDLWFNHLDIENQEQIKNVVITKPDEFVLKGDLAFCWLQVVFLENLEYGRQTYANLEVEFGKLDIHLTLFYHRPLVSPDQNNSKKTKRSKGKGGQKAGTKTKTKR
jgi:hypothetical protein